MLRFVAIFFILINSAYAIPFYAGLKTGVNWWNVGRDISGVQQSIITNPTQHIRATDHNNSTTAGFELGALEGQGDVFSVALNLSAQNQRLSDDQAYTQGSESYSVQEKLGWLFNASFIPSVQLSQHWSIYGDLGASVLDVEFKNTGSGGGYMGPTTEESIWRPGFSIGAGVKAKFLQRFVLRVGYMYQDILKFGIYSNDPAPAGITVGNYSINSKYHLTSSGIESSLDIIF
jgi:opacity protein-like surface antigen